MDKIIKCVAFTIVTAFVISIAYRPLALKDTNGGESEIYSATAEFYNTDRDLVDAVFLGSSHCYNSVYPALLWENYGIASFDMAISAQSVESTYACLKEFLKRQSPKVVFIETYTMISDEMNDEGSTIRNMLALKSSADSARLVLESDIENKSDYLLRWPIVHTRYRELTRDDYIRYGIDSYGRGAEMRMGEGGCFISEFAYKEEITTISDRNKKLVDDVLALSKKYNFRPVFFLSPYTVFEGEKEISNGIKEYVESKGLTYIDFTGMTRALGFDAAFDMMGDMHHLNMNGAKKITLSLGAYIDANFDLPDHRGDEDYYQWDKDLELYYHILDINKLMDAYGTDDYLRLLSDCSGIKIILSLEGDFENTLEDLAYFRIDPSTVGIGGKWVYENGNAVRVMDNLPGNTKIIGLSRYDAVKLTYNPDNLTSNVIYNLTPCVYTENGLNVIAYDTVRNRLFDVSCFE